MCNSSWHVWSLALVLCLPETEATGDFLGILECCVGFFQLWHLENVDEQEGSIICADLRAFRKGSFWPGQRILSGIRDLCMYSK